MYDKLQTKNVCTIWIQYFWAQKIVKQTNETNFYCVEEKKVIAGNCIKDLKNMKRLGNTYKIKYKNKKFKNLVQI